MEQHHTWVDPVYPPPPIPGVSRVGILPVFGFVLNGDLSVGHHLTETLGSCSRSLYAVRILKAHGLPISYLYEVTRATTCPSPSFICRPCMAWLRHSPGLLQN